jgi:hypothetical protein
MDHDMTRAVAMIQAHAVPAAKIVEKYPIDLSHGAKITGKFQNRFIRITKIAAGIILPDFFITQKTKAQAALCTTAQQAKNLRYALLPASVFNKRPSG